MRLHAQFPAHVAGTPFHRAQSHASLRLAATGAFLRGASAGCGGRCSCDGQGFILSGSVVIDLFRFRSVPQSFRFFGSRVQRRIALLFHIQSRRFGTIASGLETVLDVVGVLANALDFRQWMLEAQFGKGHVVGIGNVGDSLWHMVGRIDNGRMYS